MTSACARVVLAVTEPRDGEHQRLAGDVAVEQVGGVLGEDAKQLNHQFAGIPAILASLAHVHVVGAFVGRS